jgi:ATP-binding cassette subfamily C protein LapB
MLARTLLRNPDVLLADEPTAHLDLSGENSFRQAITGFLQSHPKKTLVLSTHKLALLQLVNRVILLDQGRVLMDGPTAEVVARLRSGGLEGGSGNSVTP